MATSALLAGANAGAQTATPTMKMLPSAMNVNTTTTTSGTTTPQNLPATAATTGALAGVQTAKPVPVVTAQPAIAQVNQAKTTLANAQTNLANQSAIKAAAVPAGELKFQESLKKGAATPQQLTPSAVTPITPQPMTGISAADLQAGKIDANGNPINQPTTAAPSADAGLTDYQKQMQQNQDQSDQAYQTFQNSMTQLQNGTFPLNPMQQAQVDGLKGQFQQLIEQQKIANKNYEGGIAITNATSGRARYAPEIALGITMNAVNAGIQKIGNIETEMNAAVANMEAGFQTNNMKLVQSAYEAYQQHAQAKSDQLTKVYSAVANAAKDAREFNRQVEKDNQELSKWEISKNMELDKFDYAKSQDLIQNALSERKITNDQANQLMDYQIKMKQLDQGNYVVTQDAFGNPMAFNKKTGQFENSAVSALASTLGINEPQNNAYKNAIISASLGMKKEDKQSVNSQVNDLLKKGDIKGAQEFIIRTATENSTGPQKDQMLGLQQSVTALSEIKGLLDAYVKKTGDDTGIWAGNIENAMQKIGKSSDPELAKIGSLIAQTLQVYRKGISGAAFSVQEAAEYAKLFPDFTNGNGLNTAKINALLDSFNRQRKVFLADKIGPQNYEQIFGTQPKYSSLVEFKIADPQKYNAIKDYASNKGWNENDVLQYMNSLDQGQTSGFNQVGGDTNQASLGQLSQKYESSGNPGAIGYDSTGGWSYGTYQLAHNNAQRFVAQSPYAKDFEGVPFNSQAFRDRWKQIAQKDPQGFAEAQEQYIAQTHYEPLAQKAAQAGLDLSQRDPVLAEVIFSTGVQHGPATDVVSRAIAKVGPNASDADIIKAIYNERWGGGARFGKSTPQVKKAVYNRFFGPQGELATALKQLNTA